ncbi:MAG TPA: DEAD/DEAH box helicase [Mycobacteriales bacterium]|jgi:ATP-dependent RNA helicase HelY|nr:DEAD/DEAH box helicase [Mycobacteriales bacterium]
MTEPVRGSAAGRPATPAERYAASRRRATPQLREFAAGYEFGLDPFQLEACAALEAGEGVLVAAPTGAGKTVVGEFAVHLALATGRKCFYTTPIKALSNQKYADLVARHGTRNVGLLTGDSTIRGEAPVVVMTTEVLRNMLYAGSGTLAGLGFVVMDEVHYLSDRFRGAVWEEVIIHLDPAVRLVSLSATVSNAEEFGAWLQEVRGGTRVVVEEHRPVPLWQHVLAGDRLQDLYQARGTAGQELVVNPFLTRLARDEARHLTLGPRSTAKVANGHAAGGYRRPRGLLRTASRPEVLQRLDADGLLPAITFIFSRAGCDGAVQQCLRAGLRLTTDEERRAVRAFVTERTADLPEGDLQVLGYWEWLEGLERGLAAHHAGLLPMFKQVVEELFSKGLVKAVFATETLALGINMPARSVVLERLTKWNGETHAEVTAGEYTQLTGRAGRRGIDVEGHAVVLWTAGFDPQHLAGLAGTRTYPLRSSFRPSYNMAVNLVGQVGRPEARRLLEQSFAQFQADRAVVGLARQVIRAEQALAGYAESATCHRGDVGDYDRIRQELTTLEAEQARAGAAARRAAAAAALDRLLPGDVIDVPAGRRSGVAVVLSPGEAGPTVLTADRQVRLLTALEVPHAVQPLGRVRLPKSFNPRSPQSRRDLVSTLRAQGYLERGGGGARRPRSQPAGRGGPDPQVTRLRAALRAHPVHACDQRAEHLRWLVRAAALERETAVLRSRVASRTGSVARTFDLVCAVLDELRYLEGDQVLPSGRALTRVYSEADLVVVECLRRGLWEDLDPAALAAVCSALVYESRRDEPPTQQPPAVARDALEATARVWRQLSDLEAVHRLDTLRRPDPGFAWAAYQWASGAPLERVLTGADLLPGDFVRNCKQLIDLLGQLGAVQASSVAEVARRAADALTRGVVAYA